MALPPFEFLGWGLLGPKDTPLSEGPCRTRAICSREAPPERQVREGFYSGHSTASSLVSGSGGHAPRVSPCLSMV